MLIYTRAIRPVMPVGSVPLYAPQPVAYSDKSVPIAPPQKKANQAALPMYEGLDLWR